MLKRAVCDTGRGDNEPVTALVFALQRASCGRARRVLLSRAVVFVVKTLYAKLLC
jgi:hypothetical protein